MELRVLQKYRMVALTQDSDDDRTEMRLTSYVLQYREDADIWRAVPVVFEEESEA